MKNNNLIRSLYLIAVFLAFLTPGCEEDSSFGEDLEKAIVPTNMAYPEILNAREFSRIESAAPHINSNNTPIYFTIESVKRGTEILGEEYLNSLTILNPEGIEVEHEGSGQTVKVSDISKAGTIILEEGNPFANGDYYFSVKATVAMNSKLTSTVFEDVWHLQIGPALVEGLAYCPSKLNIVNGSGTTSNPADTFGGNPDFRFELGSETDKIVIDPATGEISANPSYSASEIEYITPIINIVSNLSEEVVSFENAFTVVLSPSEVILEKEVDYFLYPKLKPTNKKILSAGGANYSRHIVSGTFAGWVKDNNLYREAAGGRQLKFQEVLDERAEAGVAGVKGLQVNYWGPLTKPFETWAVISPVNLTSYAGCYDTKLVFWVQQSFSAEILDLFAGEETPVGFEVQITDNFTGDVTTTDWTSINDILTCKIGAGDTGDFVGTPYPLSGTLDPTKDATGKWVKCEIDLADYGHISNFTLGFRTKTNYEEDLPFNLRGDLIISDVYYVAKEK